MEIQIVHNRIFEMRGSRVILDIHLAELYDTQTRILKQAVRRNLDRYQFADVYEVLDHLLNPPITRRPIGFKHFGDDPMDTT